jgi:hypothetical protein
MARMQIDEGWWPIWIIILFTVYIYMAHVNVCKYMKTYCQKMKIKVGETIFFKKKEETKLWIKGLVSLSVILDK